MTVIKNGLVREDYLPVRKLLSEFDVPTHPSEVYVEVEEDEVLRFITYRLKGTNLANHDN